MSEDTKGALALLLGGSVACGFMIGVAFIVSRIANNIRGRWHGKNTEKSAA